MEAARYVTIRKASQLTGLSEDAINSYIKKGEWLEGREWVYSPNGRRMIDMEGYEAWVESGKPPNAA